MAKLSHGTVVQTLLMALAFGPDPLLRRSTGAILEIGMILDLPKSSLMQGLLMGVMLGPSHKFDCSLIASVDHAACTTVRRFKGHRPSSELNRIIL